MLLMVMSILGNFSDAQTHYEIRGSVVDENNKPLSGANVFLFPIKKVQ